MQNYYITKCNLNCSHTDYLKVLTAQVSTFKVCCGREMWVEQGVQAAWELQDFSLSMMAKIYPNDDFLSLGIVIILGC